MAVFSTDTDILKYEPGLFGELHFSGQVLVSGTGATLSGTTLTASGADFVSAQVAVGSVVYLESADDVLDGAYEVVSVDSATQLSVSVVRSDSSDSSVAPPAGSNVSYRICTFAPQASEVGFELSEYFGISPGDPASGYSVSDIMDTSVLRRASVFGVIASIYASLASKGDDENFWKKSLHYQRLFEKARERCRLSIDSGSDGVADVTRYGGSVRLVRD